jgi:hypothetical protein
MSDKCVIEVNKIISIGKGEIFKVMVILLGVSVPTHQEGRSRKGWRKKRQNSKGSRNLK